jgi:hypothetical protein
MTVLRIVRGFAGGAIRVMTGLVLVKGIDAILPPFHPETVRALLIVILTLMLEAVHLAVPTDPSTVVLRRRLFNPEDAS